MWIVSVLVRISSLLIILAPVEKELFNMCFYISKTILALPNIIVIQSKVKFDSDIYLTEQNHFLLVFSIA